MTAQPLPLDLHDPVSVRRRSRLVTVTALVVGAAFGGLVGLIGGRLPGVVAAVVVALPLVLLAWAESRRRVSLTGTLLSVRALGTRTVDLHALTAVDVLVTEVRGVRTVSLLVTGGPSGRTINLGLASYVGNGGRELGIVELRTLADVLAGAGDPRALVHSELLVAQLRAEAREAGAGERPLFRLASAVPAGRLAQRLHPDTVTSFVAALD
ncbi:hypothetical protein [Kutzneria albida]|uniref:Uncharacterized protein n=1 Tax=Kutzneria albida DSM 43870 TaxID=1449976 RepID=W5WGG3_9PSEU|nr:hypothetical protein [Kutzneria albida]AHH99952.1 hypothetical protein KALB_6593 [Kutzneria albida DSM 43870]